MGWINCNYGTSSQYTEYSNYDSVSIADSMNVMQPSLVVNYIIKT